VRSIKLLLLPLHIIQSIISASVYPIPATRSRRSGGEKSHSRRTVSADPRGTKAPRSANGSAVRNDNNSKAPENDGKDRGEKERERSIKMDRRRSGEQRETAENEGAGKLRKDVGSHAGVTSGPVMALADVDPRPRG